jgi:hypothetical protein
MQTTLNARQTIRVILYILSLITLISHLSLLDIPEIKQYINSIPGVVFVQVFAPIILGLCAVGLLVIRARKIDLVCGILLLIYAVVFAFYFLYKLKAEIY